MNFKIAKCTCTECMHESFRLFFFHASRCYSSLQSLRWIRCCCRCCCCFTIFVLLNDTINILHTYTQTHTSVHCTYYELIIKSNASREIYKRDSEIATLMKWHNISSAILKIGFQDKMYYNRNYCYILSTIPLSAPRTHTHTRQSILFDLFFMFVIGAQYV